MGEREWLAWPEDWMSRGNTCMNSYIEGSENWCVECKGLNPHPLYGHPEWATEYELGYRYYVLVWNLYDSSKDNVMFYKDPFEAQQAFEKARDPFGKHA